MRKTIRVLSLLLSIQFGLFAQNLEWVRQISGPKSVIGYSVSVDDSGYVYTTGTFEGTIALSSGPNATTFTSVGDKDSYITKHDSIGNLIWARRIYGYEDQISLGIALDEVGDIYVVGRFEDKVYISSSWPQSKIEAKGYFDCFIYKLSKSGSFIWSNQISGNSFISGDCIALDHEGNIFIGGIFLGTAEYE